MKRLPSKLHSSRASHAPGSRCSLHHRTSVIAIFLISTLVLAGCGGLLSSDEPAASEWWLEPSTPKASTDLFPYPLVVHLKVVPGLDSDRVLNLNQAGRLNAYAGAYWSDRLPDVLGSLVSRSLADMTATTVRQGDRTGANECLLTLEFEEFFGRLDSENSTSRVVVSYNGLMQCPDNQLKLAGESTAVVNSDRLSLIISGFQDALDESIQSLVDQLATP